MAQSSYFTCRFIGITWYYILFENSLEISPFQKKCYALFEFQRRNTGKCARIPTHGLQKECMYLSLQIDFCSIKDLRLRVRKRHVPEMHQNPLRKFVLSALGL